MVLNKFINMYTVQLNILFYINFILHIRLGGLRITSKSAKEQLLATERVAVTFRRMENL